jgi:hypothetical protein
MAVLSALAHGNGPGGVTIALAAIDAIHGLPDERAKICFDLIRASLNEAVWRTLEGEMLHGKYEYKSDFARRYVGEGLERGQLQMARTLLLRLAKDRFGLSRDTLRRAVAACADLERLTTLHHQLGVARDRQTAERLVAALETKRARPAGQGRPARPRSAKVPRVRATRR